MTCTDGTVKEPAHDGISPRRIQAWREVNELLDRELMRGGRWLV